MKSILTSLVGFLIMTTPVAAHAGLLSFLGIGNENTNTQTTQNSQTVSLLEVGIAQATVQSDEQVQIDSTAIAPGTSLRGTTEPDTTPTTDQISLYVVHDGDTIKSVAKMFGVSEATIRLVNDLEKNTKLKKDQVLTILPIDGIQYTVKKGDTLKSIAKKYSADAPEIAQFNDMTLSDDLVIGDILIIPDAEVPEVKIPAKPVYSGSKPTSPILKQYSGPTYEGYYIRPVQGRRTQGLHGKNGVDIGAKIGTPIVAAASGTVIVADVVGYNGGYGEYVVISHPNGTQTLYGHMSKVLVSTGDIVSQGQTIGLVGNTGKSTGSHVHFEVRGAVNPIANDPNYGLR